MNDTGGHIKIYLEVGGKRTFAGAVDWPGWCRSGRDEGPALRALFDYAPRYAGVLHAAGIGFEGPRDISDFTVVERLAGNATTDFGAPAIPPAADAAPVDEGELERLQMIIKACWDAFEAAAGRAAGRPLRTGLRGGGRSLEKITQHVLEAEAAYLSRISYKLGTLGAEDFSGALCRTRQAAREAMAADRGAAPERGPRGGARWTLRYYMRRSAWHILDHAWEIEDRTE